MCASAVYAWHNAALTKLHRLCDQQHMATASVWLLSGPRGTGIHDFAMRVSEIWLGTEQSDHADRLLVQPITGQKEITVEQMREVGEFMHLTSLLSPRRVMIIDTIDALNHHAANALLKSLEEPPASTLCLLISHRPYALLPTLRSRCMELRLPQPTRMEALAFLATKLPEMDESQYSQWLDLAAGAPLEVLDLYAQDSLTMIARFHDMLVTKHIDMLHLHQWLAKLPSKDEMLPLLLLRYTQQYLHQLLIHENSKYMIRELLIVEGLFNESIYQLHEQYVDAKSLVLSAFTQLQHWFQQIPRSV